MFSPLRKTSDESLKQFFRKSLEEEIKCIKDALAATGRKSKQECVDVLGRLEGIENSLLSLASKTERMTGLLENAIESLPTQEQLEMLKRLADHADLAATLQAEHNALLEQNTQKVEENTRLYKSNAWLRDKTDELGIENDKLKRAYEG